MINRRDFLLAAGAAAASGVPTATFGQPRGRRPNFVLILTDDLGYGDIQPYGGSIPTPALQRMASEGLVATDYYCPANVCTPSRAGILTGRYPVRTGLGFQAILYDDDRVLPLSEKTIATALKPDYATGLFGKWHLGHTGPTWLPIHYGFDRFFGIPFSHDIQPLSLWDADAATGRATSGAADVAMLQQKFYSEAERFIESNRSRPFFCELALSAPHLPAAPSPAFRGKSKAGPYGDFVLEIDSIVSRLFGKLEELRLDRNTIVIFTSDNGAWFEGSNSPLRDRKGGPSYDGGYRTPFIAWGPGVIKSGRTNAIICGIDLLPTFCKLAGRPLPEGIELDGRDVSAVLTRGAASPHDQILLFNNEDVAAVRTQRWKYVNETYDRGLPVNFETRNEYLELYDMSRDQAESYSVAETFPDVTRDMQDRLRKAREIYAPFKKGIPPIYLEMLKKGTRIPKQD